ncbi:MAG: peptidoglycan bridge formation glycyltransferase FemA/FemB family protein [Betaproteobacteria bacterium]|nr:peptidoglycan bridge formation glycyltransferase FemA/FemB family protein [Betaproteobacteria bacterium]
MSHLASDFAAYYREMYVPYVRSRHGAGAYVQSARRLRRAFRRGGLLWVSRNGERRAGLLFEHRQGTLVALAVGTVGDPVRQLKEGAIAALYVHMLDHARSAGCADIDLRGSRPSLDDGITRFKRKWGGIVYDRPDVLTTTLVHWHRMTPAAREFLTHTSLVFRDAGTLSALAVAGPDERAGADPGDTWTRLGMPGLHRMIVLGTTPAASNAGAARSVCVAMPLAAVESGPRALLVPATD